MKKLILATALAACTPAPVTPERQLSAVQMLEMDMGSFKSHCTIWHLEKTTWVTAAHCTRHPETLSYSIDGIPLTLVKADYDRDVAVFEGPEGAPDLKLGNMPLFGASVHYIGYPWYGGENHLGVYDGRWGTCKNSASASEMVEDNCEFSALVDGGASGSPVLDADGKVVGLVSMSWDGKPYSYAVPVRQIKAFLAEVEAKI